jgi:DNA-binding LacI/PurR family transcriptional regulator
LETITIKDIARMCGVGVSTVSRAMNNHPDINEETKNKVMEIIKEYNYIPNNSARNLKLSDSRSIAILVKGISNPFFLKMIKVMEDEIQKKRYALVLHHVEMNEDEVDVALELIKEKRLRGIVFLGGYFSHTKEKLEQLQVPFVLSTIAISQKRPGEGYSSVSVDDVAESYKIVDYLCKLGHKRIATIVASACDESIGSLRQEGYRKALKDNGVKVDESLIYTMKYELDPYTMENGYAVMNEILAKKEMPTAVYAISDTLAIGACKAILESGRRIPEDISVAGFDGIDMAYFYSPSITTIRQPIEEIAKETVTILFDVIKGKAEHQHKTFEGELVIGESTRKVKG